MKTVILGLLLALAMPLTHLDVRAADPKPPAQKKEAKPRALPFHGNIGTVDKAAKTVKVGKRVFQVTADTKLMKNGKTATLNDAAPGDEVGGSYRDIGGTLTLISLRIGPKP